MPTFTSDSVLSNHRQIAYLCERSCHPPRPLTWPVLCTLRTPSRSIRGKGHLGGGEGAKGAPKSCDKPLECHPLLRHPLLRRHEPYTTYDLSCMTPSPFKTKINSRITHNTLGDAPSHVCSRSGRFMSVSSTSHGKCFEGAIKSVLERTLCQ